MEIKRWFGPNLQGYCYCDLTKRYQEHFPEYQFKPGKIGGNDELIFEVFGNDAWENLQILDEANFEEQSRHYYGE